MSLKHALKFQACCTQAANPVGGVLAGAVEACLSQGLRRRALGLFKTSSTTALLHKVAKSFVPAAIISRKVMEIENSDPNRYECKHSGIHELQLL
jgi:hypothetical protein